MDEGADDDRFVWVGLIQMRSVESDPADNPRLQPGGTLRAYVLARSQDEAMMAIVEEVTNEEYELLVLESLDPVTPDGWPHSWDEGDARCYKLALQSETVVFGEISRWEEGLNT